MKKICQFLLLLLSSSSFAQITFDASVSPQIGIGSDFYTVQISSTETKYLFEDSITNTFSLYNMDLTPFISNIAVPEPFDRWAFQVVYVTRTLFDCDSSNIEYVYEAASDAFRTFYIMRTDGTLLFRLDSANGPFCAGSCLGFSDIIQPIKNTSAGAKLFLQRPFSAYNGKIFIYSLCGSLLESSFDFTMQKQEYVTVFPNPASAQLTFDIILPDNMNEYELVIRDINSREIGREKMNSSKSKYTWDVSNFSSGEYYYTLCTKNKAFQAGKFIITK